MVSAGDMHGRSACRVPPRLVLVLFVAGTVLGALLLYQASWRFRQFVRGVTRPAPAAAMPSKSMYDQSWECFSGRPVTLADISRPPADYDYRFTVAGHLRSEVDPRYPFIGSFVTGMERIRTASTALAILGDIQTTTGEENWDLYDAAVRTRVSGPVLLALGGHDIRMRPTREESLEWYRARYGPEYHATRLGRSLAIVLCTLDYPQGFDGAQLDFLMEALREAQTDDTIDHVFLFMHRVMWFWGNERYRNVIPLANATSIDAAGDLDRQQTIRHPFWDVVFPLLRELAVDKPVYLFAGDVGKNAPIIYDRLDGVHLIATGCRGYLPERTWNHVIDVYVQGKDVRLVTVGLEGVPLARPEHYDLDYWAGCSTR